MMDENNQQAEQPIDILMMYGATRYVAEEYINLCLWDNELSNDDNLNLFQSYLDEMNVLLKT